MARLYLLGMLLCVLGYTIAQEAFSPDEADEDPLVRCKRPLCSIFCPFGFMTDVNGCQRCDCMANPCEILNCKEDTFCQIEKCTQHPCKEATAKCVTLARDCPAVMCAAECPYGFLRDAHGCDTCRCSPEPGRVIDPTPTRPPGWIDECPQFMCMMLCEKGFQKNEKGCEICRCKEDDPCQDNSCTEDQICFPEEAVGCSEHCPPPRPSCKVHSTCHLLKHMFSRADERLDQTAARIPSLRQLKKLYTFQPQCKSDGHFSPRQCHPGVKECWCVDDRGQVVVGSHKRYSTETDKPTCKDKRTTTLNLRFNFQHDLADLEEHLQELHAVMHKKVSEWMNIEETNIIVVKILPHEKLARIYVVHLVVVTEGEVDLPSAYHRMAMHMHAGHCKIAYHGGTIEPQPESLQVKHEFDQPRMSSGLHSAPRWKAFCRRHKTMMIAGGVAVTAFLLLTITVTVLVCKRKRSARAQFAHKRFENMENFKKNLVQGFEHPDMVKDKENTVTLIASDKQPVA